MKKILLVLLCLALVGCATIERGSYLIVSGQNKVLTKTFDYPYNSVYSAIISTLEKRLNLAISRTYTNENTIFSTYAAGHSILGSGYMYLFTLKKIDENKTEVTLKSKGGITSTSDNDMLNKYVQEELEYSQRMK